MKREGAFVSLMVGFFDDFGITISELRHSKVLGETSAVNGSQYSRSFSGHVPVPPTCIVVYMCYILAAIPVHNDMEGRPRKRGRYNTHRRDVSLQKPKSTVYRRHHKARQLDTAEDDQSSEEINDALLESVTSNLILSNDSNHGDPKIRTQHFPDSGMSFSVSHYSPQDCIHTKTIVMALWI